MLCIITYDVNYRGYGAAFSMMHNLIYRIAKFKLRNDKLTLNIGLD